MADTKSIGIAYRDQDIEGADNLRANEQLGFTSAGQSSVTQATNKATGVTSTTASTQITMNGAALNTVTTVAFTFTNALIGANDHILVSHASGGTAGSYNVWPTTVAAGSCVIQVRNISGGSLSEAIVLNVAIVKGG